MQWSELEEQSKALRHRAKALKDLAHYEQAKRDLVQLRVQLKDERLWDDPARARRLGQQAAQLTAMIEALEQVLHAAADLHAMIQLGRAEADEELRPELTNEVYQLQQKVQAMEVQSMLRGEYDGNNAFLEIQAGQGGTEAQDWAEMLLRMYLRWCERRGFATEMLEYSPGEVAGIKGASALCRGDHAYGWLRTETGIHRLVRKSPFDAGNRRHTSFASVFVSPELDDSIEIDLNPKELRVDTYRASGAGGQHVNKTDSAVRITHLPTGLVVQCQNQRSQHQNKEKAMHQLRAKLYRLATAKIADTKRALEASKDDISWGHQIRSYVLDASRIKDLRTGIEVSDCGRVLDGDLDLFIEAGLRQASAS